MKYVILLNSIVQQVFSTLEEALIESSDEVIEMTDEELETLQRKWRNIELSNTDYIVPITDHSLHSEYITYRQELRDWTDTSDFPDTKPTLQ